MEIVYCDEERSKYIKERRIIRENGEIIKYSPDSEKILVFLQSIKNKINTDHLAMPQKEFKSYADNHLAHSMIDYTQYKYTPLAERLLSFNLNCNKEKFFLELWKELKVLLQYGILYFDIHALNILINEKFDFKIIDLDDATLYTETERLFDQLRTFMNLIVQCYIFYDSSYRSLSYINTLVRKINLYQYFPKDICELFLLIMMEEQSVLEFDMSRFIKLFEDKEKIDSIRNILIRR